MAFMRYVNARYESQERDLAYRIYVTDCLRIISENTAKYSGGKYVSASLHDILYPKPEDTRTGEEIAADIIRRAGLEVR